MESLLILASISDGLIALSYLSIPIQLVIFASYNVVSLRKQIPWIVIAVVLLFALFILLCGFTHLMNTIILLERAMESNQLKASAEVVTLVVVKIMTALVSLLTSLLMLTLIPRGVQLLNNAFITRDKLREQYQKLDRANVRANRAVEDRNDYLTLSDSLHPQLKHTSGPIILEVICFDTQLCTQSSK